MWVDNATGKWFFHLLLNGPANHPPCHRIYPQFSILLYSSLVSISISFSKLATCKDVIGDVNWGLLWWKVCKSLKVFSQFSFISGPRRTRPMDQPGESWATPGGSATPSYSPTSVRHRFRTNLTGNSAQLNQPKEEKHQKGGFLKGPWGSFENLCYYT